MHYYSEALDTPSYRRRQAAICYLKRRIGIPRLLRAIGHANKLPIGFRTRIIDFAYPSEYSPSEPFEVDFFGMKYPGNLNCLLDWHVYFFGAHEQGVLFLLKDLLMQRNGSIFVDVGGNVGQHSLFMSRFAREVHSFEPWEVVRNSIVQKIHRNKLTNVFLHPVGLGVKADFLPYYAPMGSNTGTGSFSASHATDRNRLMGHLEIVNGDEYFDAHKIRSVDLIKIDAEGWEKYVLQGLAKTLSRDKPVVFAEISDTTLATYAGLDDFVHCIPDFYEALYVDFTAGRPIYARFDATRPGNVLLRARS